MEETVKYVGIDVHSKSSVWCALDEEGKKLATGKAETTFPALGVLARELGRDDSVVFGQEVGTRTYLVHDAITAAGFPIASFNAGHLRMIAASRKKTDARDAYWIAKALQTGMTPHPVYVPTGEIRELRRLLSRRRIVQRDRNRWQYRARSLLRGVGVPTRAGGFYIRKKMTQLLEDPDGMDTVVLEGLGLCERQVEILGEEFAHIEATIHTRCAKIDAVRRLMTIPGVGPWASASIYAAVGDVRRFPNAKALAAYAGLVPSVRQSGDVAQLGTITKTGSAPLRAALVQCAHVLSGRTKAEDAAPLQAIYARIRGTRGRRKVAIVALARHLLRIAYYILRDGTCYDARRIHVPAE